MPTADCETCHVELRLGTDQKLTFAGGMLALKTHDFKIGARRVGN
jgi:hypothetical protein